MVPLDEKTVLVITYGLIKLGIFISAFSAFYFLRMQRYQQYSYAFKKYSSTREKAAILLMYLIGYTIVVTAFMYVIMNAIPW